VRKRRRTHTKGEGEALARLGTKKEGRKKEKVGGRRRVRAEGQKNREHKESRKVKDGLELAGPNGRVKGMR